MLELPEAVVVAGQIDTALKGRRVVKVRANQSPHKFAWFFGDPEHYPDLLEGKTIENTVPYGSMIEMTAGDARIILTDGVNIRYCPAGDKFPAKHQLYIEFEDATSLVVSVQMYGGLWAFPAGQFDNPYYRVAREKPSPLSDQFDYTHFLSILASDKSQSLSAKAFLATEQRIPGLGSGVLQDILWMAGVHPKRKMMALSDGERRLMFEAVKLVLHDMTARGGRDTERDLYGRPGGYKTVLSKNTVGKPCPRCGTIVQKSSYMGGSIYYCTGCQKL